MISETYKNFEIIYCDPHLQMILFLFYVRTSYRVCTVVIVFLLRTSIFMLSKSKKSLSGDMISRPKTMRACMRTYMIFKKTVPEG